MKKYCFFASVLFISANVFGMYSNEASSSNDVNRKRIVSHNQEFVPNKKHISSADVFEKSSANNLKRNASDDMEVEEDSKKSKVFGKSSKDIVVDIETVSSHDDIFKDFDLGVEDFKYDDIYKGLGLNVGDLENEIANPDKKISEKFTLGYGGRLPKHLSHYAGLETCEINKEIIKNLIPKAKSDLVETAIQGYVRILKMKNQEPNLQDWIKLHTELAGDFQKLKSKLKEEKIFSDIDYAFDLSTYEDKESLWDNAINNYTDIVCKLLSFSDNEKERLNSGLNYLKENGKVNANLETFVQELFENVIDSGRSVRKLANYQLKY